MGVNSSTAEKITLYKKMNSRGYEHTVQVQVNANQINDFHNQMQTKYNKQLDSQKKLILVKKECADFEYQFNNKRR